MSGGAFFRWVDRHQWRLIIAGGLLTAGWPLLWLFGHVFYWPATVACDVLGFGSPWLVVGRSLWRTMAMRRLARARLAELEAAERALDAQLARLLRHARKGRPS